MSYDLNILAINQKNPTKLPFKSKIEVQNEFDNYGVKRYHSIWSYMTQMSGVWYSLVREEDGVCNAYKICDSDYEIEESKIDMPYWIYDEDIKYNLTPLIIREDYENDFKKIIKYLIKESPIKTIMLLARYQSTEHEIVCGVLTLDEFNELLNKRKILFNVCYIIRGDAD